MIVLRDCRPLTPNERLAKWREQYDRLPVEQQAKRLHVFDFRPAREPVNPDEYMEMRA